MTVEMSKKNTQASASDMRKSKFMYRGMLPPFNTKTRNDLVVRKTGDVSAEVARDQAWLGSDPDKDELARVAARELVYVIYRVRFAPHLVYFPAQTDQSATNQLGFQARAHHRPAPLFGLVSVRKRRRRKRLTLTLLLCCNQSIPKRLVCRA